MGGQGLGVCVLAHRDLCERLSHVIGIRPDSVRAPLGRIPHHVAETSPGAAFVPQGRLECGPPAWTLPLSFTRPFFSFLSFSFFFLFFTETIVVVLYNSDSIQK